MELKNSAKNFIECIAGYFAKEHKKVQENIALCTYAMVRCETVNTAQVARAMHEVNGQSFKTNDMRVYRLLQSKNFQVSDRLWRAYLHLIFKMLEESGLKDQEMMQINVDFTSDRDDFLILCASVSFQGHAIPLYFSLRNYPKRAGAFDQKKMELAFFKALRHLLPRGYRYCIVADRGFGNQRIIEILENLHFDYVIRLTETFHVLYQDRQVLVSELPHRAMARTELEIPTWNRCVGLVKQVREDARWVLAVSEGVEACSVARYEQRFGIEKMFKNLKSGGFDLERLLIAKYDRFKRMLFMACLAYAILTMAGLFIHNEKHAIKKNFALHLNVLAAFSS